MEVGVRQRGLASSRGANDKPTKPSLQQQQQVGKQVRGGVASIPWYLAGLFVLLLALMCSVAIHFYWKLPDPLHHDIPNDFLVANARRHLLDITDLGIRHVGSEINEVHTKKLLLQKLEEIRAGASTQVKIEISEQLVSGNYYLDFLGGMTHLYQNITNIAAKLYTEGTTPEHAFLINAHYDSALGTIAASDDAVSCSTMLEVLRCLSSDPDPLLSKHGLIFLFNGAEETILQASHGFITQHPWAKEIRAFLNLEAAGAGGREIVFQTGPDHPWLARLYAKSVPHPHASIVAQEIFQSGVIPSDTDFRVFRDYGHIPGIDTAYFVNGYIYHTEYDVPSAIPDGSIQRAGDNIVALLREVSNSPVLSHPDEEDRYGKVVFFDIMGLMTVVFEEKVAVVLNSLTALCVLISIYFGSSSFGRKESTDNPSPSMILKTLGVTLLSLVASLGAAVTVAVFLVVVGRSMSWYAYPIMILPLYVAPCFTAVAGLHVYWIRKNDGVVSKLALERSCFYAAQLMWTIFLVLFTSLRICSAFLFFIIILFPLVFRSILLDLLIGTELKKSSDQSMYGVAYIVSMAFSIGLPMTLIIQLIIGLIELFVPLMGRSGSLLPPDLAIAVVTALMVWYSVPHMMCVLIYTTSAQLKKGVGALLMLLFAVGLVLSSVGYIPPYSVSDPSYPRAKRFFLQHTDRTFYSLDGSIKQTDSQVMINSFDYLGIKPIADVSPPFQHAKVLECEGLYCSEPFYIPVKHLTKTSWYIPAPKLENLAAAELKLLSVDKTSDDTGNFTFQAEFPNRCSVFIAPTIGHTMSAWSLESYIPPVTPCPGRYSSAGCYFVFYARGAGSGRFTFWIEIKGASPVYSEGSIDIAVATHYLDPPKSNTPFLLELLKTLPDWVTTIGWTSMYSSWTF